MIPLKKDSGRPVAGAIATRVLPETSFEDDRAIVMGLMRASELTLAPLIEKEADIYTVADLKVRFK